MIKKSLLSIWMMIFVFSFTLGALVVQPAQSSAACDRYELPSPIADYVIAPQSAGWTGYFCAYDSLDFFYGKIKAYNSGNKTENVTVYLQRYNGTTWINVAHFGVQKNGVYHNNALSGDPPGSYLFTEYSGNSFVSGAQYRLYIDNSHNTHDVHIWIDQAGMYFD